MNRPIGISILAVPSLLGGLFYLAEAGFMFFMGPIPFISTNGALVISPTLPWGILLLGTLGTGAAIGMWQGKRWGWWLGAIQYVYGVANHMTLLAWVFMTTFALGSVSHNPDYYLVHSGLGLIFSVVCLLYLFREHVLAYLGFNQASHVTRLTGVLVLGAFLFAAFAMFRLR
ncbi:hypothetical protein DTL42_12570 [Bremerella cremea]|uniref:Uncharacterized protein n=2 Tax=Bremerella cremea TaxID=1031537 RepID=A0A368KR46_9BACT|nr:hypothetical protein DTL42_12570 [Bremerella cremea]